MIELNCILKVNIFLCFCLTYTQPNLYIYMYIAATWENQQSALAKTKAQISFAVTAKLICAVVFATVIVQSLFYFNAKFKLLALSCACPGRFVSDLFGNHIARFPTRWLKIVNIGFRSYFIGGNHGFLQCIQSMVVNGSVSRHSEGLRR